METSLSNTWAYKQKNVALTFLPTHLRSIEFDLSHFEGVHHISQLMVFYKHLSRYHDNDYLVSLSGVMAFIKDFIPVEKQA